MDHHLITFNYLHTDQKFFIKKNKYEICEENSPAKFGKIIYLVMITLHVLKIERFKVDVKSNIQQTKWCPLPLQNNGGNEWKWFTVRSNTYTSKIKRSLDKSSFIRYILNIKYGKIRWNDSSFKMKLKLVLCENSFY